MRKKPKNNVGTYIDLFSGCGGFSLGLGNAGWQGLFAVEKDSMAFETFEHNLIDGRYDHFSWPKWLPQQSMTIQTLLNNHSAELKALRGSVDLIAGGPPCQGFSMAGQRKSNDPRNKLSNEYIKVVELVKPKYLVIENVSGFNSAFRNKAGIKNKKPHAMIVKDKLESLGYEIFYNYIHSERFGIPQQRKRFLMIGISKDRNRSDSSCPFEILDNLRGDFLKKKGLPNREITVSEAIYDLEVGRDGVSLCHHSIVSGRVFHQIDYKPIKGQRCYLKLMRKGLKGCKPNSLRLANHKSSTIEKFKAIRTVARPGIVLNQEEKDILNIKKQALCILNPDKPSKTLTTLPDDLLHYREHRILTVRESARIQSFPDGFEFKGKYTTGGTERTKECPRYTQVGNAVPPLLGEALGLLIKELDRDE